jgi:exosortase/archaeosortase family protein
LSCNWLFAGLSTVLFIHACLRLGVSKTHAYFLMTRTEALIACVAGFLAAVPWRSFLQRAWRQFSAVVIAAVAVATPYIYRNFREPLWQLLAPMTSKLASGLLALLGTPVRLEGYEKQGRYHILLTSRHFAVDLWGACSGLEGVALVLCMLSLIVLFDWKLFSRFKYLVDVYLYAIMLMLIVNVIRIAAFFLYGEWHAQHGSAWLAIKLTNAVFHSQAGVWLYSATVILLTPVLYAMAFRHRKTDTR